MNRRALLKQILTAGVVLPGFVQNPMRLYALPDPQWAPIVDPDATADSILVVVRMFGGNDGLNTIVPYHDDLYYRWRKHESAVDLSIPAERVIPIPEQDGFGLHPALQLMWQLYSEGKVAIVQGVGYPHMDLSHFRGADIWLSASDADTIELTGWLGRMLSSRGASAVQSPNAVPYGIEFGDALGRTLHGHDGPLGYHMDRRLEGAYEAGLLVGGDDVVGMMERELRNTMSVGARHVESVANALQVAPYAGEGYDLSPVGAYLSQISRCIRGGLSTPVYIAHVGQFDTHHRQLEVHNQQLGEMFNNIYAFLRDMEDSGHADRVTVLAISEFGRRVDPAESGTDHGTAAPVFLLGKMVRGGMYGTPPPLDTLDDNNNLYWNIDFRHIYASILHQWFQVPQQAEGNDLLFRPYEPMDLFHTRTKPDVNSQTVPASLVVGPNPASHSCTLYGGFTADDRVTVAVNDMLGRRMNVRSHHHGTTLTLETASLPSGIYAIVVRTHSGLMQTGVVHVQH
jgi:uncharacterized protein (DUF1501 family)